MNTNSHSPQKQPCRMTSGSAEIDLFLHSKILTRGQWILHLRPCSNAPHASQALTAQNELGVNIWRLKAIATKKTFSVYRERVPNLLKIHTTPDRADFSVKISTWKKILTCFEGMASSINKTRTGNKGLLLLITAVLSIMTLSLCFLWFRRPQGVKVSSLKKQKHVMSSAVELESKP